MTGGRLAIVALAFTSLMTAAPGAGEPAFAPEQVRKGAGIFSRNCAACHGARMADGQGVVDLRRFPRDQKTRFVNSIIKGKNQMPPWGDLLAPADIDALWAYVMAGGGP